MAIIKFIVKCGIVGSAVYYTRKSGVWGTPEQSEKLYNDICKQAQPQINYVKQKIPLEIPLLPKTGEICFLTNHYYNTAVKSSIRFIYMFPCYMGQWIKKGKEAINSSLAAPPPK